MKDRPRVYVVIDENDSAILRIFWERKDAYEYHKEIFNLYPESLVEEWQVE